MEKSNWNSKQLPLPPGLRKAIWSTPSLIIPIWATYAGLEPICDIVARQVPKITIETFQILTATLIGTILYSIGDFWDEIFFDKVYSVRYPKAGKEDYKTKNEGKWLEREKRPLWVYPAGLPLKKARDNFVQSNENLKKMNGYGSYRVAKRKLQSANLWEGVENSILISKFMRSFIWPFTIIALLSGCYYIWNVIILQDWMHPYMLGFFFSMGIALLATVPYCKFRVEHLLSLYEIAIELESGEKGNAEPNNLQTNGA